MARPYTEKERKAKKKLFLEAFEDSKGLATTSCERAGISVETLSNWRQEDKEFDAKIKAIKDKTKEYVEGQLMTLIQRGTPSAIYFWLKCQGGYRETQKLEVEQTGDLDITAAINEIRKELADGNS